MLIDTSIVIDPLRGRTNATRILDGLRATTGLVTGTVVAAELLSGARDRREQREIDRLLAPVRVEPIEPTGGATALDFPRPYRLGHGIGWPDCLIAATAIRIRMPVATLNDRHFRVIAAVAVHRPYRRQTQADFLERQPPAGPFQIPRNCTVRRAA